MKTNDPAPDTQIALMTTATDGQLELALRNLVKRGESPFVGGLPKEVIGRNVLSNEYHVFIPGSGLLSRRAPTPAWVKYAVSEGQWSPNYVLKGPALKEDLPAFLTAIEAELERINGPATSLEKAMVTKTSRAFVQQGQGSSREMFAISNTGDETFKVIEKETDLIDDYELNKRADGEPVYLTRAESNGQAD